MNERARFAQATEITTATYDQIARNYAERNEEMHAHWAARMEQFVDVLAENESERPIPEQGRPGDDATLEEYLQLVPVLDAGCGSGRDSRALAAHGLPVLGVDLSQGMLDEAGERTARRLPRGFVRYALMDLRHLDLPDASCRGVWCSASLLHVPRHVAPRAVAELARVTRAGGPVAIFVKQRMPEQPAETFVPYEWGEQPGLRRYYAYYTLEEARALVADAHLRILDCIHVRTEGAPGKSATTDWVSLLARKH